MTNDLITQKGLRLDDLGKGDIVTIEPLLYRTTSDHVIYEVLTVTAAAAVLKVRWIGLSATSWNPGDKRVVRRSEWKFFEASELLEAVEGS